MEMEACRKKLTFLVDVAESEWNTLLLRCLRTVIKDTACPWDKLTVHTYGFWNAQKIKS